MAEEDLTLDDPKDGDGETPEKSGLSKKMIIIIAASGLLLLIAIGVTAWLLLGSDDEAVDTQQAVEEQLSEVPGTADEQQAKDADDAPARKVPPPPKSDVIYVSIPDPFLVNITSGKRSRMMQIKVQLMVHSLQAEDAVKLHMPLLRNNLLDFFSTADAEEVRTREGRQALKEGAFKTAQEVMVEHAGFEAIEMLLFTGFVVQ